MTSARVLIDHLTPYVQQFNCKTAPSLFSVTHSHTLWHFPYCLDALALFQFCASLLCGIGLGQKPNLVDKLINLFQKPYNPTKDKILYAKNNDHPKNVQLKSIYL